MMPCRLPCYVFYICPLTNKNPNANKLSWAINYIWAKVCGRADNSFLFVWFVAQQVIQFSGLQELEFSSTFLESNVCSCKRIDKYQECWALVKQPRRYCIKLCNQQSRWHFCSVQCYQQWAGQSYFFISVGKFKNSATPWMIGWLLLLARKVTDWREEPAGCYCARIKTNLGSRLQPRVGSQGH